MPKGISIPVGPSRVDPSHDQDENGQPRERWTQGLRE